MGNTNKELAETKEKIYTIFSEECEGLAVINEILEVLECGQSAYDVLTENMADLLQNVDNERLLQVRNKVDEIFRRNNE